jgi:hypothetical protein
VYSLIFLCGVSIEIKMMWYFLRCGPVTAYLKAYSKLSSSISISEVTCGTDMAELIDFILLEFTFCYKA